MNILDQIYIKKWGINAYVEHRLHHWAKWFNQADQHGLGYPQEALELRHLNNGGITHPRSGIKPLPTNQAAEDFEAIIRSTLR